MAQLSISSFYSPEPIQVKIENFLEIISNESQVICNCLQEESRPRSGLGIPLMKRSAMLSPPQPIHDCETETFLGNGFRHDAIQTRMIELA
jgi:hypothetical protein